MPGIVLGAANNSGEQNEVPISNECILGGVVKQIKITLLSLRFK